MYGALGIWSRPRADLLTAFEDDYERHYLPLVRRVPHVKSVELVQTDPGRGGDDELYRIGTMWFEDEHRYAAASESGEWKEMFAYCDSLIERYELEMRYALVRRAK